jgi:mRNA-degrading endonuclease RelE of RelBE toxin-antitoxin system
MVYRVVLADSAKADANAIYERVVAAAPHRGPLWFDDLIDCLYSLDHLPLRCPLAREAAKARRDIRCLLFGKRRNTYRILYEIDKPRKTVWVLHIRHGARRDMEPEEIASLRSE